MAKKIMAMLTAFVLCGAMLCGCAEKENKESGTDSGSSTADSTASQTESAAGSTSTAAEGGSTETAAAAEPGLTIDGQKVETDGLVMLTVDGRDIDFDTFRYYYFGMINQLSQSYGATLETLKNSENGFQILMDNVIMKIKQDYVTFRLAEENGLEITEEDKKFLQESYDNLVKQAGSEEKFAEILRDSHLTVEVTKNMLEHAKLYEKTGALFSEGGKYATSKDDFRKIVKDPDVYACVRSILIPYECKAEITNAEDKEKYDSYSLSEKMTAKKTAFNALTPEQQEELKKQAEELAKDVAKRANSGEDFEALLAEYGWDRGMEANPQGYYITHATSFVPEYIEAVFKLKEGEVVSEPVLSSSYGWFIIKRNPVDMEYVEQNIDSMLSEYDTPTYQKVYTDIMDSMNVTYSDTYNKLTIDSIT